MGYFGSVLLKGAHCQIDSGSVKVQAVSLLPLTAEARVGFLSRPCGICGGNINTRIGVSPGTAVSLPV